MNVRKPVILLLLASALALLTAGAVYAGETIAVIVNRENPTGLLSDDQIRMIYTNKALKWADGTPIVIYDLAIQDPLRAVFSKRILGRTPYKVAEDWAHLKITNQAKNPPLTMKSQRLIIRRVARDRGAIGYVSISSVRGNLDVRIVGSIR
jgi:ABC-type phosphate transport system substrate-binding protein